MVNLTKKYIYFQGEIVSFVLM